MNCTKPVPIKGPSVNCTRSVPSTQSSGSFKDLGAPGRRPMPVLLSRWDEVPTSRMVTLGKHGEPVVEDEQIRGLPSEISVDDWVKAAEFVPGQTWKKMMGMFIIIIIFIKLGFFFIVTKPLAVHKQIQCRKSCQMAWAAKRINN